MVRSSRVSVLCVLSALLLPACGGDDVQTFGLAIEAPATGLTEVAFPVAVVRGVATGVETLTLRVSAGDETYAFAARPGTTLAFRVGGEPTPPPVKLAGLEVAAPSPGEVVRAFGERLQESAPEASVREPVGEAAFLVDLPVDREDLWPEIVRVSSAPADLRFLIEVLPLERYRSWREVRQPPRLEKPPYPWNDTAEAFDAFKESEVKRWLRAKEAGRPYEPSRPDLLVLPKAGTEALAPGDFAVLEWPEQPEHRFDGRMLANPFTSKDPNTGKPIVLYDVRESYQEAFGAWTGANVGLPMAILLDWVYRSAPTINSPLTDSVQITLGSGSFRDLQAKARALTRTLGSTAEGPPATLVAVCTWRPGGALELLLPLEERVDTTLAIEARGAAPEEQAGAERTLRFVPGLAAAAADSVDARLAEIALGALEVEAAAPLLRADPAAAVEHLARIAAGGASAVRRRAAVELLGLVDATSAPAAEALVSALDAEDADVALAAVRALRGPARHHDGAFDALLRVAASGDESLQGRAVSSLLVLGAERREQLLARVDDPDSAVRRVVLSCVGSEPGDPSALPLVLSRLKDEDADVRRAALLCLWGWGGASSPGSAGEELTEHLGEIAACLEDEDRQVRGAATEILAGHGAEAFPLIRPYLASDRAEVRAAALGALSGKGSPSDEARVAVESALEDPALLVRLTAAVHRAMRTDDVGRTLPIEPEGLAIARDGFASEDQVERQLALWIAWSGGAGVTQTAPWIEPLLDDEEEETRVTAAIVLKKMDRETERSKAILAAVLADADHPMHAVAGAFEQSIGAE